MTKFPSAALLQWYGREKRDLPWRGLSDPYAIWVSEVILQQTRVEQGTPYFHRFMEAFPTVADLANAEEDHVLKLWEGLGYYSRARNMHAAARQVAKEMGGVFPTSYDALRSLKGIGPYTAAAISSIAAGEPRACVDGNVTRVLARFHGITEPTDSTATSNRIASLAQEALGSSPPGDHNQAMMELGAMVCVPRLPRCADCPLRDGCSALSQGLTDEVPRKGKRTKVRERFFHYILATDGERTLLRRRPAGDIWQGLYEFPLAEADGQIAADEALRRVPLPGRAAVRSVDGPLVHVLSHQRIRAVLIHVRCDALAGHPDAVLLSDLGNYALPRLLNRFLEKS